MSITTRTQIPAEVNNWYDRKLLLRVVAAFIHGMFAQVKDIPRKGGTDTIKFRRYGSLAAATTALTEGVTPASTALSVTDITAQVSQYGAFVTVTDVLTYEGIDNELAEATEILGDQAGDTLDQLTRDVINAGTSVSYANSRTSRVTVAAADLLVVNDIRACVRTLKGNNAKKLTEMVTPTDGYGTSPINRAYIGFIHPNITYTLKLLTGFVPVEEYASQKGVMPNEVGKVDEVRFVESTNCKVFTGAGAAGIDVYSTVIVGAQAYGITRISGEALKNIIKPLGSGGTSDPLDQRATSGWKATFVPKILNDNFMTRIESAAV